MSEVEEQKTAAPPTSNPASKSPFTQRRRIPRRSPQTGGTHSIHPGSEQQQQYYPQQLLQHPLAQQPVFFTAPPPFSYSHASSATQPSGDLSAGFALLSLSSPSGSSVSSSSFDSRPPADGYRGAHPRAAPLCFRCCKPGHKVRDCREPPPHAKTPQADRSRPPTSAATSGSQRRLSAGQPLPLRTPPFAVSQPIVSAAPLSSSQPSQSSTAAAASVAATAAEEQKATAPPVPAPPESVPSLLPPSFPPVTFPPADDDEKAPVAYYSPAVLLRSVTEDRRRDPLWLKFGRLESGLLWFLFIFENQRERRKGSSGLHVYADSDFPDSWGRPVLGSARCAFSLNEHDKQCWRLIRFLRVFLAHGRVSALRDERLSAEENERLIRHLYADVWSVMYFLTQSCHFGSQQTEESAQSVRAVCDQHALADLTPEGRALRHHRLSLPLRFFRNGERGGQHLDFTSRWYTAEDCRHEGGRRAVMDFGLLSNEFRAYLILMLYQYWSERLQPRGQKSVLTALVNADSMRPTAADSAAATALVGSQLAVSKK